MRQLFGEIHPFERIRTFLSNEFLDTIKTFLIHLENRLIYEVYFVANGFQT